MRSEGIEPPTLWFEARCSNPLSYERKFLNSLSVKILEASIEYDVHSIKPTRVPSEIPKGVTTGNRTLIIGTTNRSPNR